MNMKIPREEKRLDKIAKKERTILAENAEKTGVKPQNNYIRETTGTLTIFEGNSRRHHRDGVISEKEYQNIFGKDGKDVENYNKICKSAPIRHTFGIGWDDHEFFPPAKYIQEAHDLAKAEGRPFDGKAIEDAIVKFKTPPPTE